MELWIRSQDKKRLTKVEDVYMVEDKDNFTSYIGNNIVGHLGEYKKVGRALEVLEEIQRILKPVVFMSGEINTNDNSWVQDAIIFQKYKDTTPDIEMLDVYVYEMPEE